MNRFLGQFWEVFMNELNYHPVLAKLRCSCGVHNRVELREGHDIRGVEKQQ